MKSILVILLGLALTGCDKSGKLREQLAGTHIVLEDGLDKGDRIILRLNKFDHLEGQWNTKFTKAPITTSSGYYDKEMGGLVFTLNSRSPSDGTDPKELMVFKLKCVFDGVDTRVLEVEFPVSGRDDLKVYKFSKEN